MNWLFLKVSSSLCYSNSLSISLCKYFSDPPLMEGFPYYIVPSNPFPSSTCLSSNPALKYLSYWAAFLVFCGGSSWKHCSDVFSTLMRLGKLLSAFNAVVVVFPQDISVFLSLPCAPEIYLCCWNFLEGYPSQAEVHLTDIR